MWSRPASNILCIDIDGRAHVEQKWESFALAGLALRESEVGVEDEGGCESETLTQTEPLIMLNSNPHFLSQQRFGGVGG